MKIFLDTIGCRLNQAEIETYARHLRQAGHSLVANPEEADLAIVNTCAVTASAVSDSRQKIRQIQRSGVNQIIATGCWATLEPHKAAALQGVQSVIANHQKDNLVLDFFQLPSGYYDKDPLTREPIPGARQRTRAFIKVQDGCNNFCAYCITIIARGPSVSRSIKDILVDIHVAEQAKEIVLTGVHLGSWGADLSPRLRLGDLIQEILKETDQPRLRLSSLEPWDLNRDFYHFWENPRLCRHLHLPLQSGCDATLQRMFRKTTTDAFHALVQEIRLLYPDIAITTDVITGFPGETEAEFQQSLDFVRSMRFAGGHVFTYSPRPGTAAAVMPNQVPKPIRKERNAQMRSIFSESARAFEDQWLGAILPVLWESAREVRPETWELSGLTGNYLRVRSISSHNLWNEITPVLLSERDSRGLFGIIKN